MKNIANVAHDLKPIAVSISKKTEILMNVEDEQQFISLLSSLNHDSELLIKYFDALEEEILKHHIEKIDH